MVEALGQEQRNLFIYVLLGDELERFSALNESDLQVVKDGLEADIGRLVQVRVNHALLLHRLQLLAGEQFLELLVVSHKVGQLSDVVLVDEELSVQDVDLHKVSLVLHVNVRVEYVLVLGRLLPDYLWFDVVRPLNLQKLS